VVTEILPIDPFTRKQAKSNTITFAISEMEYKPGRGDKNGVKLRWFTLDELNGVAQDQRKELMAWRSTKEGKVAT